MLCFLKSLGVPGSIFTRTVGRLEALELWWRLRHQGCMYIELFGNILEPHRTIYKTYRANTSTLNIIKICLYITFAMVTGESDVRPKNGSLLLDDLHHNLGHLIRGTLLDPRWKRGFFHIRTHKRTHVINDVRNIHYARMSKHHAWHARYVSFAMPGKSLWSSTQGRLVRLLVAPLPPKSGNSIQLQGMMLPGNPGSFWPIFTVY